MKLTKENILSVCNKYLFIFYKNEKYGYWDNDSPRQIYAINKNGFICRDCRSPYYFNRYLEDDCELHTTLKSGGFLFSLQRLNLHNQLTSNRLCSD